MEMSITLFISQTGKLESRALNNLTGPGDSSNLLYLTDKSKNIRYLIDTGAEVCVYPKCK